MIKHRKISPFGLQMIKLFEGFSNNPYLCSGGYYTIGYGHKITKNELHQHFTKQACKKLFSKDIVIAERSVIRNIRVPLSNNQFDALVSFTFNVGGAALQRSTLRQKINSEYFDEVPHEFMKWIYSRGRKLLGLINRRRIESNLFMKTA